MSSKSSPAGKSSSATRESRRRFLKQSLLAAPLVMSLEERALAAQSEASAHRPPIAPAAGPMPGGKIGSVSISRLICGGNLISGYAHSRDLTYVSPLLKHYFTDEKIFETWALCERHGINTMVAGTADARVTRLYQEYIRRGGKIQYIAQINPTEDDLRTSVRTAADAGAVGAFLLGNLGDRWAREGAVARIGQVVATIQEYGLIAGVAGHSLKTIQAIDAAGVPCDFHVKTLHHDNYWSKRRPEQKREVIDNYKEDNYWCMDADETVTYMAKSKRPWIAYKVLAAGAIQPRDGFRYAFQQGADFLLVGMFDFQVAADVKATRDILAANPPRQRPWVA